MKGKSLCFADHENIILSSRRSVMNMEKLMIQDGSNDCEIILQDSESGWCMSCVFPDPDTLLAFKTSIQFAICELDMWRGKIIMPMDTIDYDKLIKSNMEDRSNALENLEDFVSFFGF
ncbi:hypothetical protein RF11_13030 [Thelohanellus kitauei]|uniref:Uncharacterized protein n=1 Tax=Thelohanellus kitauei TaxID=669202 RepID=A0A0C2NDU1_THEKT|nr:hypothetical protein RF11_13030 [Thelohanellus kitauei]